MQAYEAFVRLLANEEVFPYLKAVLPVSSPRRPLSAYFNTTAQHSVLEAFGMDPMLVNAPMPSLM